MGSRYGGLKQIDPMGPNGETMLDYSVHDALQAGFSKVVFVIRRDFESAFKEAVGSRFANKIEVAYAFQDLHDLPGGFSVPKGRERPWGTGHAIRAAREVINSPFVAINADDFYGGDSFQQIANYFSNPANATVNSAATEHYCMVGFQIENTLSDHGHVSRGVCTEKDGYLVSVEEHTRIQRDSYGKIRGLNMAGESVEIPEASPVSMNFWGFTPSAFDHIEDHFQKFLEIHGEDQKSEFYIPFVVDELIKSGVADCRVLPTESPWFGVTYPEDKPIVTKNLTDLVNRGAYPALV